MTIKYQKTSSKKIEELEKLGYADQFIFDDGKLIVSGKNIAIKHQDITIDKEYRYEGISNPDDMSILYAISTRQGYKGTILLPYGTYGNSELTQFLMQVEDNKQ